MEVFQNDPNGAWDIRLELVAHRFTMPEFSAAFVHHAEWARIYGKGGLWSRIQGQERFFTSDVSDFTQALAGVAVGGDEAPFVALDCALDLPWSDRPGCRRIVIMMTDEPLETGALFAASTQLADELVAKINALKVLLFLVSPDSAGFEHLVCANRALWETIDDGADISAKDLRRLLLDISASITKSQPGLGGIPTVKRAIFGQDAGKLPEEASIIGQAGMMKVYGPYTPTAGKDSMQAAQRDRYGNPDGPQFDLARDGAFSGAKIAVLHLYTGEGFGFSYPKSALEQKGFSLVRWSDQPPAPAEFKRVLADSCQLWIISDRTPKLACEHLEIIKSFFDAGHGLYIWGDNAPYYADANRISQLLFGSTMSGDLIGDQVVRRASMESSPGMSADHRLCTGLEFLYEGMTIANVDGHPDLTPVVRGSAGNIVVSAYEKGGRRGLIDGGFTRLYMKWDSAGTGRYVTNAAAWLANYERFGRNLFQRQL